MTDTPARGGADGDVPSWLTRLVRLFEAGHEGRPEISQGTLHQQVEELILGGPRRYTRDELLDTTGMQRTPATRLWRSMGFAEVGDEEVVFTDRDLMALHQFDQLRATGVVPSEVQEAVTRTVGQAMAGLAEWQVEMVYQLVETTGREMADGEVSERQMLDIAVRVLPLLEQMQSYVWRRHLAAAAGRVLTALPSLTETKALVVGFADLVGFTRTTRQLSPGALTRLIEDFYGIASEVVAECHGRVVKTVGDEVLWVTDRPVDAAAIALGLMDRFQEARHLPELRIGMAYGEVLTRYGDVYGEEVNIAARLTTHARPGRILINRRLADELADDPRFQVRLRRPIAVRGYSRLQPWGLRRREHT